VSEEWVRKKPYKKVPVKCPESELVRISKFSIFCKLYC
jgi:hypothetical protein